MVNRPSQAGVHDAAAAWFARRRGPDVAAATEAEFRAWLKADPRHADAWNEISGLWDALDRHGAEFAVDAPGQAKVGGTLPRRLLWKPALGLAAAAVAGVWVASNPALFADYRTGAGERRTIELADGIRIDLDAASAVSVKDDDAARRLRLVAGRFIVEMPRDATRVLTVLAGEGSLRLAGGVLDLHERTDCIEAALLEGAAELSYNGRHLSLAAGTGVGFGSGVIKGPAELDPNALAWRRNEVICRRTPLRDLAKDLERYRGGRIMVDAEAGKLLVTGAFDARTPDAILDALGATLPVRVRRVAGYLVLISAT